MNDKILLLDQSPSRMPLYRLLGSQNYDVVCAANAEEAVELAAEIPFHLFFMDHSGDGLEACRRLRTWSDAPILLLSSTAAVPSKLAAFEIGVDDYILRPFEPAELLARVRSHLRRARSLKPGAARVNVAGLEIDLARQRVRRGDDDVHLTPTEFSLLKCLTLHRDRILSHAEIIHHVWGDDAAADVAMLRVYIRRLRRKLEADTAVIVTAPGLGYSLRR